MEQGYIENGFIVDVSNAKKTSEIIYQLSTILDLPDAHCKKVCLKLGEIELSASELLSIKALVESMNSEIEFVTTLSPATVDAAMEIGLKVSELENKVQAPDFNQCEETAQETNKELEKALDKIFGDSGLDEPTFQAEKEMKKLKAETDSQDTAFQYAASELSEFKNEGELTDFDIPTGQEIQEEPEIAEPKTEIAPEFSEHIHISKVEQEEDEQLKEEFAELEDFNKQLEKINKEVANAYESDKEDDFLQIQKSLRETEKLPTLYIQRTLRSGQSITAEGNIVVIGDVNPGSEIKAKGDITVWGILGGIAHAGSDGNKYARIRALKMHAIQLRIADVFARRPDSINIPYIQKSSTFEPEEARVKHKQIIISKMYEN